MPDLLPEYARPPVAEVVLAIAFEEIVGFSAAHHGLFWSRIREIYPRAETHSPLFFQQEQPPGQTPAPPAQEIGTLSASPQLRSWFLVEDGTQLIQVQSDGFIRNWRKRETAPVYPRYHMVRESFVRDVGVFRSFLEDVGLRLTSIVNCEISYINHVVVAEDSPGAVGGVGAVLKGFTYPSPEFLPQPEAIASVAGYPMYKNDRFAGRLRVSAQPAFLVGSGQKIINLTLAARSRSKIGDMNTALEFFDSAHEWIVRGFTDFTTNSMHELWGRTR